MSKKLVVYFSASGVTAAAAKELAEFSGSELYEIKPEVPYTTADLDWQNERSRSFLETHTPSSRPEIKKGDIDVSEYEKIYLGFPVWWGIAPHIVNTFLESYDFSGKTIVLFATSGKDGLGESAKGLKTSVSDSTVIIDGSTFSQADADTPRSEILKVIAEK